MRKIGQLAWCFGCLLLVGVLLVLPGNGAVQRLVGGGHAVLPFYLLAFVLALPAGAATMVAAFLLEWLIAGWRRSSLAALSRASPSVRLDMLAYVVSILPKQWVGYALSVGLLYVVDLGVLQPRSVSLTHLLPAWGLQVACLVLFQSFISYWMHRLEHAVPALWALHQFHHSADRMSILTTDRQTSLTRALEQIVMLFFLALFTDPTADKPGAGSPLFMLVVAYFVYRIFMGINHYLCHSNLTTDYGWLGRWVVVSPRMHRLHHSAEPRFHDKNFTFDLVIWDRLFGTYAHCDLATLASVTIGLNHNPFNSPGINGLAQDYFVMPYVILWKAMRAGPSAWMPKPLAGSARPAPQSRFAS